MALRGGALAKDAMEAIQLRRRAGRRPAVPEAPVDHALGGQECRHRLATAPEVVELATHEGGEKPLSPMRRQHGDGGHARRMHFGVARDGERHVPVARRGHDAPALEPSERVPLAVPLRLDLHLLVADLDPERDVLSPQVVGPLLGRDRPDLEVHLCQVFLRMRSTFCSTALGSSPWVARSA